MKKVLTFAFVLIFSGVLTAMADNDKKDESAGTDSKVKNLIMKEMTYPTFASEQNVQGEVYVSFEFNKDGKVDVLRSNSANPALEKYVIEKLKTLQMMKEDVEVQHVYNMKFTFTLY